MENNFLKLSFSILIGIFSIFCLSFTGFLLNVPINSFYCFLGILFAFLYLKDNKTLCLSLFLIIFISYLLSILFYDYSYDGRTYHQLGIILLEKGWNPVFTKPEDFLSNLAPYTVVVENYPKFLEIFAANIVKVTGQIEAGKIIHFLSLQMTFLYAFYVLNKNFLSESKKVVKFLTPFLLVYNPVVLVQMFTYYNDGLVYLYFILSFLAVLDLKYSSSVNKTSVFVFIMSSLILCNIKLGGIFLFLLTLIPFLFLKNISVKNKILISASIFVLILISGINPYFTNIKEKRHPFYPLMGENKMDMMTFNTPSCLKERNYFEKFFISTFSKVSNKKEQKIRLKIPFTIHKSELVSHKFYDTRLSGFGVFFSGILILSLFCISKNYAFAVLFLILTVMLNPENWWARYVPQLWAAVVLICVFSNKKRFSLFVLYIMLVNSLISNIGAIASAIEFTNNFKKELLPLKNKQVEIYSNDKGLNHAFLRKLEENKTGYKIVLNPDKNFYKVKNVLEDIFWKF